MSQAPLHTTPDDTAKTLASELIEDFSIDPEDYRLASAHERASLGIPEEAYESTQVFLRGETAALKISLSNMGSGNRLFISDGCRGTLSLGFSENDSNVFIGRDVVFSDQHIGSRQSNDLIAVGNDVAVTGPGRWISGLRAGKATPTLIIGDACVISRDVAIRNSDGHPIMDPGLREQVTPSFDGSVVIEPHCWLGERCAVLKTSRIGAFSIVGFAAVVGGEVPRHHTARGNPVVITPNKRGVWAWDDSPEGLDRARKYLEKFPYPAN